MMWKTVVLAMMHCEALSGALDARASGSTDMTYQPPFRLTRLLKPI